MEDYTIDFTPNLETMKKHRKHLRKQLKAMPRYILDIFSELAEDNGGDVIKPFNNEGRWLRVKHKSQRLRKYQEKKARCQT